VSDAFKILPTQEWDALREPLVTAIEALPLDERKAVILVHVLGYKEESQDADEETAATRCKCTGRTIRNRLTRAAAKLSRFKEDI
jgi:DNA-directed RNA polymerase specialized sigma24 family protein